MLRNFSQSKQQPYFAGIIVDTRNFTLRTGSRTFDTASYLKSVGADTILIQRLLKENVDTYLMRSHLLNSLEMLPNNVGIVHGEENTVYPTVVAAQTADMMLSMENIDASFVVTKRNDGRVGISARSLGNKNVQRVMEKWVVADIYRMLQLSYPISRLKMQSAN